MSARQAVRQNLVHESMEWIHVSRNLPQDIEYLRRRFQFHPIDLRDTLPPLQRHKLVERAELGYAFMILIFPVFDRKTKTISTVEVDFFIHNNVLVTVTNAPLPPLEHLFDTCKRDASIRKETFGADVMHLLLTTLDAIYESLFPMVSHLSADIDEIEKDLYEANQRRVIMEILRIKINIVNVRKAMHAHVKVIEALIRSPQHVPDAESKMYFNELVEHAKEIWDSVELQNDTINALHQTHGSLIDNRTNDVIKTLTLLSVLPITLTLIVSLFAMDTGSVPFRDDPTGFYKIMILLIVAGAGMTAYFGKKKWF